MITVAGFKAAAFGRRPEEVQDASFQLAGHPLA